MNKIHLQISANRKKSVLKNSPISKASCYVPHPIKKINSTINSKTETILAASGRNIWELMGNIHFCNQIESANRTKISNFTFIMNKCSNYILLKKEDWISNLCFRCWKSRLKCLIWWLILLKDPQYRKQIESASGISSVITHISTNCSKSTSLETKGWISTCWFNIHAGCFQRWGPDSFKIQTYNSKFKHTMSTTVPDGGRTSLYNVPTI